MARLSVCIFLLILCVGSISALKEDLMLQGTLLLQPELQATLSAAIDIYVDHMFGTNPILEEYFGAAGETMLNALQIFSLQSYPDAALNNAFAALNMSFGSLKNFTTYYPVTYAFMQDVELSPKRLLALINTRIDDYATIVSFLNRTSLPTSLSLFAYTMADADVFADIDAGNYTAVVMKELWATLNFTVTEAFSYFNLSSLLFTEFAENKTNDLVTVLDTLGITNVNVKAALNILQPTDFLFNHTILAGMTAFFKQYEAFGSFIEAYKVLTHKNATFLDVYRNLAQYCDLWGTYPPTGAKYHMVINETLHGAWMIELNTAQNQSVGQQIYKIEKTYNANSYQSCNYPYLDSSTASGISFGANQAFYNTTDNTLRVTKASAPDMKSDGTPLICRDALYAIGALVRNTALDEVFDSVQNYIKVVDFMQPLTDLASSTVEQIASIFTGVALPGSNSSTSLLG